MGLKLRDIGGDALAGVMFDTVIDNVLGAGLEAEALTLGVLKSQFQELEARALNRDQSIDAIALFDMHMDSLPSDKPVDHDEVWAWAIAAAKGAAALPAVPDLADPCCRFCRG